MPEPPAGDWIAVGKVLGAIGSRGELRVQPLSRFPQRFRELRRIFIGEARLAADVLHRRTDSHGVILRLSTASSREEARGLGGEFLYVPEAEAVTLPAGEFFVHQIVGLRVLTVDGEALGQVREVLSTGSNDVYLVRGAKGEVLLPATKEVIKQIDLESGQITVQLLPGLID